MSTTGSTTEELLRRARGGDERALEVLFEKARAVLARWASRPQHRLRTGGARPSDVAQESALRAFQHFGQFRGSTQAELDTWLKTIFLNQLAQVLRSSRRKKRHTPELVALDTLEPQRIPARQRSPSQVTAHMEDRRLLLRGLSRIPEPQRQAIYLCYLEELPVAEAAGQMKKTKEAVTSLLQRGLRSLRGQMIEGAGTPAWNRAVDSLPDYLRRRDRGEIVDPEAFAAGYPGCADELRTLFQWLFHLQSSSPRSPPGT